MQKTTAHDHLHLTAGHPPYIMLDGASGTMLQKAGLATGAIPEVLNLTDPEQIIGLHLAYLQAGARIVYANTFGASPLKLADCPHSSDDLVTAGVLCAREAVRRHAAQTDQPAEAFRVALDIGPLGELLEPNGSLAFEDARAHFAAMVAAGQSAGCDLVVIETMTDLYEARAAVLAARETAPDLPVLLTMSYEKNGRTFTGSCPAAQAALADSLGVTATGINCSLGPAEILPILCELGRYTRLPLIIKANAGLPDPATGLYSIGPADFAAFTSELYAAGVRYFGGCCGTTPDYIRALEDSLAEVVAGSAPGSASLAVSPPAPADFPLITSAPDRPYDHVLCCSPLVAVTGPGFKIVGERLNPTGKPRFRQALRNREWSYLQRVALQEEEAGADILDVNVGAPDIDEAEVLSTVIPVLQSVVRLPLQLDSAEPAALEAALRVYNGKAIVNSVNGKAENMAAVLPLVKRYGASVIGLVLDETGIPETVDDRLRVARRIVDACDEMGIPREDIIIDCLALTVSAQPEGARVSFETIRRVHEELGVRTLLGISNISFGLPERRLINRTFLAFALANGLDLGIVDPNDEEIMDMLATYRLIDRQDENGAAFISRFTQKKEAAERRAAEEEARRKASQDAAVEAAVRVAVRETAGAIVNEVDHALSAAVSAYLPEGVRPEGDLPALGSVDEHGRVLVRRKPIRQMGGAAGPGAASTSVARPNAASTPVTGPGAVTPAPSSASAPSADPTASVSSTPSADPAARSGSVAPTASSSSANAFADHPLMDAVIRGLADEAGQLTEALLSDHDPMELVDGILIPALDVVGERYESGRIFLPQLIQSANAAQQAFERIRVHLAGTGDNNVNKGTIIVATVEGDVHDIGKNIVKVILENYGYRVIDLGKNVPVQKVVEAAVGEGVKLVGLSALMTTTLKSMEKTIKALRESGHDCKIMAGGAVLTPDYARTIGADFYVKDAKASVDVARRVFGEEEEKTR